MEFKWTKTKQYVFKEIKHIMARDTLLAYPYFNEELKIHTYASNFQLRVVIRQKVKPIAFYSIKQTDSHKWYTVTEK